MPDRYEFFGPEITPAKKRDATAYLDGYREGASQFHEAELEKTDGEKQAIALVNDILKREFVGMGISDRVPEIKPERFHVMSGEWFDKNNQRVTQGTYHVDADAALLSRERAGSSVEMYKLIFHEAVHAAARQKHWLSREQVIETLRTGYKSQNFSDPRETHNHLVAFNEGVVEMTTQMLFYRYSEKIEKALSVSEADVQKGGFVYGASRAVIREICEALAENDGVEPNEVWKRIKKGQFTGEMMHLRDIEYTYGRGALRILDALRVGVDDSEVQKQEQQDIVIRNEEILEYFRKYDRDGKNFETARDTLAREILGDKDYQKYCK